MGTSPRSSIVRRSRRCSKMARRRWRKHWTVSAFGGAVALAVLVAGGAARADGIIVPSVSGDLGAWLMLGPVLGRSRPVGKRTPHRGKGAAAASAKTEPLTLDSPILAD